MHHKWICDRRDVWQSFVRDGERFEVQGMGFVGTFLKESVPVARTRFVHMIEWGCIFVEG